MNIPSSTYRIQFHKDFTFSDLDSNLDYLRQLGVHTIYAAPVMKASAGSMHGYDVTDPHVINPEVGSFPAFRSSALKVKESGMQWLQDIVPNHMAYNPSNARLMDVFERGAVSPYYNYFDINWDHHNDELKGRVMLPFLGKELDAAIEDKEITLRFSDAAGLTLTYYDDSYPVNVNTWILLLGKSGDKPSGLKSAVTQYIDAIRSGESLQLWSGKRKELISRLTTPAFKEAITAIVSDINNRAAELKTVCEQQHYIFTCWKRTEREINYRRFFTVNSLICLAMERDDVFGEYHYFIHKLFNDGLIQGVRIDHIDGLNNPSEYLQKLRSLLGPRCYIVAEKILEHKEEMPGQWPLEGTSGYEFLSYVNRLFTDRLGAEKLIRYYYGLVPVTPPYEELVFANKKLILENHMAGELENLVEYFLSLELQGPHTRERMTAALSLLMLSLPVYRIYPEAIPLTGADHELMEETFTRAVKRNPSLYNEIEYLHDLCRDRRPEGVEKDAVVTFLRRLMQFTGPLTAKGVEDTTFYVYNPLISHDEVGDAPSVLGIPVEEFHELMIRRQATNPLSLNATATHDTKRGEDARIRLNVISGIPDRWIERVNEWMALNKPYRSFLDGADAPSLNDEYFIYQSILGGFPESFKPEPEWIDRLQQYLIKVVREAKAISNWESPHTAYEDACSSFIMNILQPGTAFVKSLTEFMKSIFPFAEVYSVAQAVVKITAPGIPDIYQGCELWDLSYVDPDNRRPVDYAKRKRLLTEFEEADKKGKFTFVRELLDRTREQGSSKLFATWKALNFRKANSRLFSTAAYIPLHARGFEAVALAYARATDSQWVVVVVPMALARKNVTSASQLKDIFISLPVNAPTVWRNIFTGEEVESGRNDISLAKLLNDFPVAVLYGDASPAD